MDSERLILTPGHHDLEETIEECWLGPYDGENGIATLHLTLRSPQTKVRAADRQSTTLAVRVEEAVAIKLLHDVHVLSIRMNWSLGGGGFQKQVMDQPRRK